MKKYLIPAIGIPALFLAQIAFGEESWSIGSVAEWKAAIESSEGVTIEKGVASSTDKTGSLRTKVKTFKKKCSAKSLTIEQSALWQNWEAKPRSRSQEPAGRPRVSHYGPGELLDVRQVRRYAQERQATLRRPRMPSWRV